MEEEKLTRLQKTFLTILEDSLINVSVACEKFGISRMTFYRWKRKKTFAEAVDDLKESSIDFTETMLLKNIKAGKEKSIFYFLTNKAKSRGYGVREVVHDGALPSLCELVRQYQEEKKRKEQEEKKSQKSNKNVFKSLNNNTMEKLIENLKKYEAQGLDTKEAMVKLFEEEDLILTDIIEKLGEKREIALSQLIKKLEEKSPLKRLKDAIDAFADEEKTHPVQPI